DARVDPGQELGLLDPRRAEHAAAQLLMPRTPFTSTARIIKESGKTVKCARSQQAVPTLTL
ncbi:MAG TPA: hypothetical protein P5195_10815, partial [Anaerolineae bacterium]|nr:hypothetical protein [Anaerolineae bacterium]